MQLVLQDVEVPRVVDRKPSDRLDVLFLVDGNFGSTETTSDVVHVEIVLGTVWPQYYVVGHLEDHEVALDLLLDHEFGKHLAFSASETDQTKSSFTSEIEEYILLGDNTFSEDYLVILFDGWTFEIHFHRACHKDSHILFSEVSMIWWHARETNHI